MGGTEKTAKLMWGRLPIADEDGKEDGKKIWARSKEIKVDEAAGGTLERTSDCGVVEGNINGF